ncbi:MAG: hydrogenase nickel incorporation protein HypB [Bacteroidales bacterium]|jgi:hydrogenase nickel incorporation protein HypB|nr:hydrogenase nickel incorporation protein HypB [Bacteroidales bacterium]MDD4213559.1 hydrogenase nickel incorporation protein HypB [Bacteroidales bacterium]
MCDTCGCNDPNAGVSYHKPGEEHTHEHSHEHGHEHHYSHEHEHHHGDEHHSHHHEHSYSHEHSHDGHTHNHDHNHEHTDHSYQHEHTHEKEFKIEHDILNKNNMLAERNRGYFEAKKIKAINLVSSPGSGKTTLLEKTIAAQKDKLSFFVIEGDQQTMNDADRIHATRVPVIQINTGSGCHLDAEMINKAVKQLDVSDNSILLIENVGNLVCPAMFDLGESHRVVVISVTEGDDKPLKYPHMFHSSDICIINKTDLLPYVDFNVEKAKEYALRINHHLEFFELSAKTGQGMDAWYAWLKKNMG